MGVRKKTINTFATLALIGGAIVLLSKGNQKFDILGALQRGLSGIPEALAAGVSEGISNTAGVLSETQTGSDPNSIQSESEALTLNFLANKTSGSSDATGFFDISAFTGNSFLGLGDFINNTLSLRENEIISFNPVRATTRTGTQLQVFGASGIDTGSIGIRNLPLSQRALSRTSTSLIGSFTTPTGGTRDIRGSPELFERLRLNLGG